MPQPARAIRLLVAAAVLTAAVFGTSRAAGAATIDDLVNLKSVAISDDILIALIQTDGSVFHLSAADIPVLRQRGLSERVLLAMIATARPQATVPDPATAVPRGTAVAAQATSVAAVPDAPAADRVTLRDESRQDESRSADTQMAGANPSPLPAGVSGVDSVGRAGDVPPALDLGLPLTDAGILAPVASSHPTAATAVPAPLTQTIVVPVYVPVYVAVGRPGRAVAAPATKAPEYWGWGGQRRPDSWQDAAPAPKPAASKPAEPKSMRGGSHD